MSLEIPTRCSLPDFSPLSIASVFGNSVLLLLVFNETSVFAILDCRATLGSGVVILPGRFNGGLCIPLHQKTRGNQSSSGADSVYTSASFLLP